MCTSRISGLSVPYQAVRCLINVVLALCAAIFPLRAAADDDLSELERFIRIIEKYDVSDSVKSVGTEAEFWPRLAATDPTFNKFMARMNRDGRLEKRAIDAVERLPHIDVTLMLTSIDSLSAECQAISAAAGFDPEICRVVVADHRAPLASVALTGHGYAIIVNSGLWNRCDTVERLCVVVREYVHGYLLHHLQQELAVVCGSRASWLLDGLIHSIFPYGYYVADSWRRASAEAFGRAIDNRMREQAEATLTAADSEAAIYLYPFCDDLEVQADIVAYRFMDRQGHGDRFIESVAKFSGTRRGGNLAIVDGDELSRSTEFRVNLLKFMAANPDLELCKRDIRRRQRQSDPIYGN